MSIEQDFETVGRVVRMVFAKTNRAEGEAALSRIEAEYRAVEAQTIRNQDECDALKSALEARITLWLERAERFEAESYRQIEDGTAVAGRENGAHAKRLRFCADELRQALEEAEK